MAKFFFIVVESLLLLDASLIFLDHKGVALTVLNALFFLIPISVVAYLSETRRNEGK